MADTLFDLLSAIDAEHRRLDDLVEKFAVLLTDPSCQRTGEIPAPCRKQIGEIIGRTLITCVTHFMHEYEAMHRICAPQGYINDHADEHDALLAQLRALVESASNRATSHDLLQAIETLNTTMHRHRYTTDETLYRYLHNAHDNRETCPMPPDTAYLTVRMLDDGRIAIDPHCADADCSGDTFIIGAGDTFGGRTHAEWRRIANGPGRVDALWLAV